VPGSGGPVAGGVITHTDMDRVDITALDHLLLSLQAPAPMGAGGAVLVHFEDECLAARTSSHSLLLVEGPSEPPDMIY